MAVSSQSVFDIAAYGFRQAAQYVDVAESTLRSWVGAEGLIRPADVGVLSFNNLAEAHVLKALRRTHRLSLQAIRKALAELAQNRRTAHPLLDERFETDGVSLCIRDEEEVINLSQQSQREIRQLVSVYLKRVRRDGEGRVARLFPFVIADREGEPETISIDPTVAFGKPVLAGTGVSTAVIAGRFSARDSVADLAAEYQVAPGVLEDAIRWEMSRGRAA